jgi:hypothetical protein
VINSERSFASQLPVPFESGICRAIDQVVGRSCAA